MQRINSLRFDDDDDKNSFSDSLFRFVQFISRMRPFYRTNQMFVPIDLGDDASQISNYYQYIDQIIDKILNYTNGQM